MYHQHPGIRSFILFQTPFPSHPWSANVFFLLVCNLTTVLVIFLFVSTYFSHVLSLCAPPVLFLDFIFVLMHPFTDKRLLISVNSVLLSSFFLIIYIFVIIVGYCTIDN